MLTNRIQFSRNKNLTEFDSIDKKINEQFK